jgi:hypothetical protein
MIAVSLVAAAFIFAADPTPTPSPVVTTTLQNAAVPDISEIGRTRATTPSCGILRDLLVPSLAAAKRMDDRFALLSSAGPAYAKAFNDRDIAEKDLSVEAKFGDDAPRQLAQMGQTLSALQQQAKVIITALGDSRFAANADDPTVAAEQQQLRALLDAQAMRASALNEFVTRHNLTEMRQLPFSNGLGLGGRHAVVPTKASDPRPPTPLEGLPDLNGDPRNDALAMYNWYRSLNVTVHATEYAAANRFLEIAKNCK